MRFNFLPLGVRKAQAIHESSFGELESEFAIHRNPKSQQALERDPQSGYRFCDKDHAQTKG
jgi:hypothetical protein